MPATIVSVLSTGILVLLLLALCFFAIRRIIRNRNKNCCDSCDGCRSKEYCANHSDNSDEEK